MSAVEAVTDAEERLRHAALQGDVAALDALLADDLVFVNAAGHVLDKAGDLDLHRSGTLKLSRLHFSELTVRALDPTTAHTVLRAEAEGFSEGTAFAATLRFSRLWRLTPSGWQVAAIHACTIA